MLNIKLCGFASRGQKVIDLECEIRELLNGLCITDAVISIDPTPVISCDARRVPQPYVRIASTDPKEIEMILDYMKRCRMEVDVEWLVLGGFVSATKMSEAY